MPLRGDCEEVCKNYKNFVCVLIAYVCFWVGFILWAFMGSYWATVSVHDTAFTYIGLHSVCDEWTGDESSQNYLQTSHTYDVTTTVSNNGSDRSISGGAAAAAFKSSIRELYGGYESVGSYNGEGVGVEEVIRSGFHGYSANASSSPPPPPSEPPWQHCVQTLLYINPGGDSAFSQLMTVWYCFSVFSSAWVIFISLASLIFCCSGRSTRGRVRVMTLLGLSSLCLVIYLVISLITFDYGMYQHALQYASTNSSGLTPGVTYTYNRSYTISISLLCQYALGCIASWLAVLVAVYTEHREREQRDQRAAHVTQARWGDIQMVSRYGRQTEEYNRYDNSTT